jgi:hypothetical protein
MEAIERDRTRGYLIRLGQRHLALDGGKRHLGLEGRVGSGGLVWVSVYPDSLGIACPLSGRNSTYCPVQISGTGSAFMVARQLKREVVKRTACITYHEPLSGAFFLSRIVAQT